MRNAQISWSWNAPARNTKSFFAAVQEEIGAYGLDQVGLQELLVLIIGPKADATFCRELAGMPPARMLTLSSREMQQIGATPAAAARLEAVFRLFKKIQAANVSNATQKTVSDPSVAAEALSFIAHEEQEHVAMLVLDAKNHIKKAITVFKGSLSESPMHPREIFKIAVRESACSIVLGHNHPSGDPTPSRDDIEVTKRIAEAAKLLGIQLLDHIIVGSNGYRSLKEAGVI